MEIKEMEQILNSKLRILVRLGSSIKRRWMSGEVEIGFRNTPYNSREYYIKKVNFLSVEGHSGGIYASKITPRPPSELDKLKWFRNITRCPWTADYILKITVGDEEISTYGFEDENPEYHFLRHFMPELFRHVGSRDGIILKNFIANRQKRGMK